jgi:hypothetical protein
VVAANADMRMTTVRPVRCGKATDFGSPPVPRPQPSKNPDSPAMVRHREGAMVALPDSGDTPTMGVRTRGLDIAINAKRQVADAAARAEAKAVIERWNEQLTASRDILWSPTIRAALIAGTPWLDVFCPGCGTAGRSSSPRVGCHPGARPPLLVVPGNGADAEDPRAVRLAACGKGSGVEPVSHAARSGRSSTCARPRHSGASLAW